MRNITRILTVLTIFGLVAGGGVAFKRRRSS